MHIKRSRRSYTKVLRLILSKGCKWAGGKVCACSMLSHFSCVQLFETPWTIACQAPLSLGFSRKGYWSGLPCPPPGAFSNAGIEPVPFRSPLLAGGFFNTSATFVLYLLYCLIYFSEHELVL